MYIVSVLKIYNWKSFQNKLQNKFLWYCTVEIPSDQKYSLVPDDSRSLDPEVLTGIF